MGRISNQIRQHDVAGWGIAALVSGAIAVLGANLAVFVPPDMLAGLHATHIQGGSFNQLRAQLAGIARETAEINRDYAGLLTRLNLLDDSSADAVRRLAAVETSLPLLVEALPFDSDIDHSLLTASITEAGAEVQTVEGGEIHLRQTGLFAEPVSADGADRLAAVEQPMPPALDTAQTETTTEPPWAVALGAPRPVDALGGAWEGALHEIGPLLLGLDPLAAPPDTASESRIVAGPLPDLSATQALCDRIELSGIACAPAPFEGTPLPSE